MKRRLPSFRTAMCIAGIMIAFHVSAQKAKGNYIADFEDGTKIEYALYKNEPGELFDKYITAMNLADEAGIAPEVSFSGIHPGRFQYKAGIRYSFLNGFTGIRAGGTYFLGSTEKDFKQSLSIRSENLGHTQKRYVVKIPAKKGKYWGVNADFGYTTIGNMSGSEYEFNGGFYELGKFSYGLVAVGVGYNSLRGVQVKVKEENGFIGGSRLFTAVANVAFYPGLNVEATALDSVAQGYELTPEDLDASKVGFRVYVQSHTSIKYHTRKRAPNASWGFTWQLGVAKSPFARSSALIISEESNISVLFGLGFFVMFY